MSKKSSRLIKSKALYPNSRKDPVFFLKHRRLLFLGLGMIGLGSLSLYSLSKIVEKSPVWMHSLSQKAGFVVKDITVEGRQNTSRTDLLNTLQINRGDSLFSFSPDILKQKLEKLPWIRSAIVERRLPDTFRIHLAERKPLAIWQKKGKFHLLDREGGIIACAPEHFPEGLLVVVGETVPQHVKGLLSVLEKVPEVKQRVGAAVLLRSGRWDLHLDNKWVLKLPETALEQSLHHFLSFERKYGFLNQKIMTLDLRLPDIFIIRLAPDAAKEGRVRKLRISAAGKEA